MLKKNVSLRNTNADNARINVLKSDIGLFGVFSSKEMKVIFKYIRPYLRNLILLIVLAFGLSLLEGFKAVSIIVFIKLLFSASIDSVQSLGFLARLAFMKNILRADRQALLFTVFFLFVGLSVITLSIKAYSYLMLRKLQLLFTRSLRKDIYNKINRFGIDFFNEAKSGELLFMMNAEVKRFASSLLYFKMFLSSGMTIFVLFAILIWMTPGITLLIAFCSVLYMAFHQKIERKVKIASWEANCSDNALQQLFYEIIYGIKLIKLGGLEAREWNEYAKQHGEYEQRDMRIARFQTLSTALRELYFIFILLIFSGIFFYGLQSGIFHFEASFILSYLFILLRVMPFFSEFHGSMLNMVTAYGPLAKIVNLLTTPDQEMPTSSAAQGVRHETVKGIALADVSFSFKDRSVLKSINAEFTPGKIYGLVGFSGSGKTTLLDLIVGIRRSSSGKIMINDAPIDQMGWEAFRSRIGYVNQEPIIFHDTIRENVRFFHKGATDEQIDKALQMASIKDFVDTRPKRLETGLGERGLTVSGGERQRIGLARILLKDSDVVLLDEATNALDYRTEKEIYDNLKKIKQNKIIIVVAHRLSSIVDFDEIIVLSNKGQIEEHGRHQQLMEQKGVYYSLYRLQEIESEKETVKGKEIRV